MIIVFINENQDYEVFPNFGKNSEGGRPTTEYALTIDAAKEISMVEGNERGKKARRYFIEDVYFCLICFEIPEKSRNFASDLMEQFISL
jgi:hypothetical protein